jgi:hypothetical protein
MLPKRNKVRLLSEVKDTTSNILNVANEATKAMLSATETVSAWTENYAIKAKAQSDYWKSDAGKKQLKLIGELEAKEWLQEQLEDLGFETFEELEKFNSKNNNVKENTDEQNSNNKNT